MEDESSVKIALENHTVRIENIERQLESLNTISNSIHDLTLSVNKLAINMESMLEEQKSQSSRLKLLEDAPADSWNAMRKTATSTIVATVAGALTVGLILLAAKYLGV